MRGAQGRGHTFRRICSLRCEPSRSSRKNLGSVEGIGSWLMTAARAAVVGGAASRALGEGMNALPEARAIAKMIIRIAALAAWWPSEEWRVSGTAGALSRNTSTGVRAEHFTFSCQSEIYPVCLQYLLSRMCFGGRSLLLPELGTHGMRGSNTGRVQRTSEQRAHSIGSAKFIFLG